MHLVVWRNGLLNKQSSGHGRTSCSDAGSGVVRMTVWSCCHWQGLRQRLKHVKMMLCSASCCVPECIESRQQAALCPEGECMALARCPLCCVPHCIEGCGQALVHQPQQASLDLHGHSNVYLASAHSSDQQNSAWPDCCRRCLMPQADTESSGYIWGLPDCIVHPTLMTNKQYLR